MSQHPLAGVIEKLRRADAHLISLYTKVTLYIDSAPYVIEAKRDPHGHGQFIFRVKREPSLKFATIVGDILHNIRSALDYIAHELIKRNGFPTSSRTQFPVCSTVRDFDNEAICQNRLGGISLRAYRMIDALQPHQMRPPYSFADHPLWHLQKLSNLDKHHALNLSAFSTRTHWRYLSRDGTLLREDFKDALMYDGAVAGSMPKHFIDEEAKIEFQITGQVSFRDAPVANREVLAVLQSLREFVGKFILPAVEPFFDPLPDELRLTSHGVPPAMRPHDPRLKPSSRVC